MNQHNFEKILQIAYHTANIRKLSSTEGKELNTIDVIITNSMLIAVKRVDHNKFKCPWSLELYIYI